MSSRRLFLATLSLRENSGTFSLEDEAREEEEDLEVEEICVLEIGTWKVISL